MRRTELHEETPEVTVVDVEGDLDAVGGYDLRQVVERVLRTSTGAVELDLSRVLLLDEDGLEALVGCAVRAQEVERTLTWVHPSGPAARVLREAFATTGVGYRLDRSISQQ